MKLQAWSKTDPGRRRARNEDSFLVEVGHGLFAVADGMGGHQGGETASRLAVEALRREIVQAAAATPAGNPPASDGRRFTAPMAVADATDFSDDVRRATQPAMVGFSPKLALLRHAVRDASREIHDAAQDSEALHGMGTTLTAVLCEAVDAPIGMVGHILHAGDSRLYRYRAATIEQLTEDHTWIAEQLRLGAITLDEAEKSRFRHVITKSIGFERYTDVDLASVPLLAGDVLLLCSDGLSNYIENDELGQIMAQVAPDALPGRLVDLANARGGDDNITVVVVAIA
ncbi:MAG: serine/threonine-protein phosphatase [Kofleriaceae bacterium]|nr:serine/threonine-protein phosphatase [Kofleriaceae bacterium]